MSKLKKKKSQVSRDFEESLNVVIRTGFQNYYEKNEVQSNSTLIKKNSISDTLKEDLGRISFQTIKSNTSSSRSTENSYEMPDINSVPVLVDSKISKKIKYKTKDHNIKIPSFLKNLFSVKYDYRIPFETTSVSHLSFSLNIVISDEEQLLISVRKYFTIDKLITIISKISLFNYNEISLYYNNNRLEKHNTLAMYGITMKSIVQLKILDKIEIIIQYSIKSFTLSIYSSKTVEYLKTVISKKINIEIHLMNLIYNDTILKNRQELFSYGIDNKSVIYVSVIISQNSKLNVPNKNDPGFDIVQQYIDMAEALGTCDCQRKRINVITMGILAVLSKKPLDLDKNIIKEFENNLHLKSCLKNKNRCSSYSTMSGNSQSFESETSEMSSKEISLNDCIYAEIGRVEQKKKIVIEESDLEFLCNVKHFKEFKHFLKDKLGTECTLRSVSMLYKYGIELVAYIGSDEEKNSTVKRMLHYIKDFFHKYYETDIINKGGLVALTLTGSDIDD